MVLVPPPLKGFWEMAKGSGCLRSFPVGCARVRGYPARRNAFEVREEFCTSSREYFLCLWKGRAPPLPVVSRTEVFLETQAKIAGFSRRLLVRCFFGFEGLFCFLGGCFSTWHLCCGVDVTSQSDASHPHEPLEQVRATSVPGGHRRELWSPGLGAGVTVEPCGCPRPWGAGTGCLHPAPSCWLPRLRKQPLGKNALRRVCQD